jgi:hypothetical protein
MTDDVVERARARFGGLAAESARGDAGVSSLRKGFGTRSMFVGRKMFAVLDGKTGELVVKLPADRVETLIRDGQGRGWHPGGGTPLKEYVAVPFAREREWTALAREARAFMGQDPAATSKPAAAGRPVRRRAKRRAARSRTRASRPG